MLKLVDRDKASGLEIYKREVTRELPSYVVIKKTADTTPSMGNYLSLRVARAAHGFDSAWCATKFTAPKSSYLQYNTPQKGKGRSK